MLRKNRLFTPGPTPILPAAQTAMASFAMHHRTADFRALFTRVLSDLKLFIGTNNDVLVLTASGTGAMEGAVSNLTSPGDKVLVLSAGNVWGRLLGAGKTFLFHMGRDEVPPRGTSFMVETLLPAMALMTPALPHSA